MVSLVLNSIVALVPPFALVCVFATLAYRAVASRVASMQSDFKNALLEQRPLAIPPGLKSHDTIPTIL